MSFTRRAFEAMLRHAKANREHPIVKRIYSHAIEYFQACENFDYNCMSNGEFFLAEKLHRSNNLDCVLDVGANVGEYSKMIRSISKTCRILAFEPVPSTYKALEDTVKFLDVEAMNNALGNFSGRAQINIVPNASGLASLVENIQEAGGRESAKIEIDVVKGADMIKDKDIKKISLLKIDTEGYESEVLKGFEDMIHKTDVIQFEYGKANLFTKYFLHDYYRDYGDYFSIGKLYPNGVRFHDKYIWDLDDLMGPNYVMVSKARPDIKSVVEYRSP